MLIGFKRLFRKNKKIESNDTNSLLDNTTYVCTEFIEELDVSRPFYVETEIIRDRVKFNTEQHDKFIKDVKTIDNFYSLCKHDYKSKKGIKPEYQQHIKQCTKCGHIRIFKEEEFLCSKCFDNYSIVRSKSGLVKSKCKTCGFEREYPYKWMYIDYDK